MEQLQVQVSPSYYECQENVLDRLESLLDKYGFEKLLIVHGEKSWHELEPFLPEIPSKQIEIVQYSGRCSDKEINRISELVEIKQVDVLIGVGGGTILDLVKAIGHRTNKDVVLIPTLAATCAAWTPLSVIYDDHGRFVRFEIYPRNTLMVLIEPRVIAHSPVAYLRAGIADTIAKWYEARALSESLMEKRVPIQLALNTAKFCKDTLLEDGFEALQALENKKVNQALLRVIETNILAGGMVGGLGDRYGRIAAAHSVHNALTQFEETHHLLHGEKVAYGILVQLALENKEEEIEELTLFYKKLQLPASYSQLGFIDPSDQLKQKIAFWTLQQGESIHWMSQTFSEADIIKALEKVETYSMKKI